MKVLLVNTFAYPNYPCLGLGYIGTYLREHGHAVKIFDIVHEEHDYLELLRSFRPDFVGFNSFTVSVPILRRLVELTRKTDTTIMVGGHHSNAWPLETMELLEPDIIILGEGELKTLEVVENTGTLDHIEGIIARSHGKVHKSFKVSYIQDLDCLPFPDRHLMSAREYAADWQCKRTPYTHMITGRGCYGRCTFCANKVMWQRKVRRRSVDNVIDEIEALLRDGWRELNFLDDTFTMDRRWIEAFCQEILERKLDFTWKAQTRADVLDEALAKRMKKAGCHMLGIGIESGNQETLDFLNKDVTLGQIRGAFEVCHNVGLHTNAFLMGNLPTETKHALDATLAFVKMVHPSWLSISRLAPFPGTQIRTWLENNGLPIPTDYDSYRVDRFEVSQSYMEGMTPQEVTTAMYSLLYRYYTNARFYPQICTYPQEFRNWLWTVQDSGLRAGYMSAWFFRTLNTALSYADYAKKKLGGWAA